MYSLYTNNKYYDIETRAELITRLSSMIRATNVFFSEDEAHDFAVKYADAIDNRDDLPFDCALCGHWVQIRRITND